MRDQGLTITQNMLTSLGSAPERDHRFERRHGIGRFLKRCSRPVSQKTRVIVLGCDLTPEALAKIRDGALDGSVEFPLKQVTMAIDAIVGHIRENKPVGR